MAEELTMPLWLPPLMGTLGALGTTYALYPSDDQPRMGSNAGGRDFVTPINWAADHMRDSIHNWLPTLVDSTNQRRGYKTIGAGRAAVPQPIRLDPRERIVDIIPDRRQHHPVEDVFPGLVPAIIGGEPARGHATDLVPPGAMRPGRRPPTHGVRLVGLDERQWRRRRKRRNQGANLYLGAL